jgi:DNA-directed RNA polymerase specialized sigma subunit
LVAKYLPYASSIANRVAQSLSSSVDFDDIVCNARLGLLEAAQRYDESQRLISGRSRTIGSRRDL